MSRCNVSFTWFTPCKPSFHSHLKIDLFPTMQIFRQSANREFIKHENKKEIFRFIRETLKIKTKIYKNFQMKSLHNVMQCHIGFSKYQNMIQYSIK